MGPEPRFTATARSQSPGLPPRPRSPFAGPRWLPLATGDCAGGHRARPARLCSPRLPPVSSATMRCALPECARENPGLDLCQQVGGQRGRQTLAVERHLRSKHAAVTHELEPEVALVGLPGLDEVHVPP